MLQTEKMKKLEKKAEDEKKTSHEKKADEKWETFTSKLKNYLTSEKLRKNIIKNLDDTKQWAPLHYAVFNNNTFVCDILMGKKADEKHFQCGM